MTAGEAKFAAIDFESAGTSIGATDAPVQIGIAVLEGWELCPEQHFRSFLHTEQRITWAAQRVHGIRTEDLLHAPPLLQLWPEINSRLRQRVVVAHGAGTEKRFLRAFPMHGFGPWVDSLAIAQAVWPDLEDYSLSALSTQLGLTASAQAAAPGLTFHDALFDSVLSLLVLRRAIADASLHQAPLDALCRPDRSRYYARRKLRG